ncbi:hypothetical protein G8T83_09885, partial [Clostridium botulinum D/C]
MINRKLKCLIIVAAISSICMGCSKKTESKKDSNKKTATIEQSVGKNNSTNSVVVLGSKSAVKKYNSKSNSKIKVNEKKLKEKISYKKLSAKKKSANTTKMIKKKASVKKRPVISKENRLSKKVARRAINKNIRGKNT